MLIKGVKIIDDGHVSAFPFDITVEDGIISSVKNSAEFSGKYVAAGFVDIHTHGGVGVDVSSANQTELNAISDYYQSKGVTHFCPTFVATPLAQLGKQLKSLYSKSTTGAEMLRAHIEGPYISLAHKGAQPAENIITEFKDDDAKFFAENADKIGVVTMCPATINAEGLVKTLISNGIKVQGGHDDSRLPDLEKCMPLGLDGVTHIFCGCSTSVRGKDFKKYPGLAESGLLYDALTVEVIADDEHVSKELFKLIYKCKGFKKICLVSDSLSCAGMPIGNYKLGGRDVYTDGKVCYLADMSSLAGSVTSVGEMVKIVTSYGIPLAEAVYMAAETPRNYLRLPKVNFKEGEDADFVVLNGDGEVLNTYFKR